MAQQEDKAMQRAQVHYNHALYEFNEKRTTKALKDMEQAIKIYPGFVEAYSQLGAWYYKKRRYQEAIDLFLKASKNCKNGERDFALPLAKSYLFNNNISEALAIINKYVSSDSKGSWKKLKEQATFIQYAKAHPIIDSVSKMGRSINTRDAEVFPYITADTMTLFFTRRVNGSDEDFFFSKRDTFGEQWNEDAAWTEAQNMGSPPNTPDLESGQMISADEHYLFFTRCENRSANGWESGGCDLYMAYRIDHDSAWSAPESFGATINSPYFEGMPCLSPDNRELYFVSDRPGGYGGMDIWVSKFEDGLWQMPRNLGATINTSGNEMSPFLHIDNSTLFFASDTHVGMGGFDLFYSRRDTRDNDTLWSKPKNLGYPINTSSDENSMCVTVDGKRAFFSSDRNHGIGNFDIYETKLPLTFKPFPVAILQGYVYDSLTKDRLNYANIYIDNIDNGLPLYHFQSNRGDGSFMITLPAGYQYPLIVDRIGYTDKSDTLIFLYTSKNVTIVHNIALLPQNYVKPLSDTSVLTVHFPSNKAAISDSAKGVMKQVITPWLTTKNMTVFVNGYADTTGTPLKNEQLSYKRANLVTTELIELGIDKALIKTQGWGEANPIAPNSTEEGRSKNRRVEVIIRQ